MKTIKNTLFFIWISILISVYSCKKDNKETVLLEQTPGINLDYMDNTSCSK